jgi:DNA-directed RNA polymerase subunit beta'
MTDDGNRYASSYVWKTPLSAAPVLRNRAEGCRSRWSTRALDKKAISGIINQCYRNVGLKETVIFADQLMYTGFAHSTASGASIGVDDFVIPRTRRLDHRASRGRSCRDRGAVCVRSGNPGEKYNKVVDIWSRANDLVARSMMDGISKEPVRHP